MKPALLVMVSVGYGLLTAAVFRLLIRPGFDMNGLIAHILELKLFIDEPRLVLKAQRALLLENVRLLGRIVLPCMIAAAILALCWAPMDRFFGHGSLRPGSSAILTAAAAVELPPGLIAETPPVHIARLHQTSWRVHVTSGFSGRLPEGSSVRYPPGHIFGIAWFVSFLILSTICAAAVSIGSTRQ